ncbi:hypothetical protein [Streptomyces sp. NPDC060187]|uniref:hypothetical protein n=1 Tax=Streptomyces sp. NPDC060187 TaxID=3347067 RepID=UPI003668B351
MDALVGQVVLAEIARHDWDSMTCGCMRSAAHVPQHLLAALSAPPPARVGEGWADSHVYIQSNLMAPAAATAGVVAAALADPLVPLVWRRSLIEVLCMLCYGEQDDIAEACQRAVRGCVWSLYEEIGSGRAVDAASYAFELLVCFPEERGRLAYFQERYRAHLATDLHAENFDVHSIDSP